MNAPSVLNKLSKAQLSEYDFRILVDKSGSMGEPSSDGSTTRWAEAEVIAKAVAEFAGEVDDDGIDIILFGGHFDPSKNVYSNTTADKMNDVFSLNSPSGSTPTAEALHHAISMHNAVNGKKSFTVVITDGIPNSEPNVVSEIVNAANGLADKKDMTFLFLQVGNDDHASAFLARLDDHLTAEGAKFDIVDCLNPTQRGAMTFEELFYHAQND